MSEDRSASGSPAASGDAALEQELARLARVGAGGMSDLDRLRLEVEQTIARERGFLAFLRSRSSTLRTLIAITVLTVMALLTLLRRARVDMSVYPASRMALALGSMAVLFALTVVVVLWPLQRPAPPRWLTHVLPLFVLGCLGLLYSLPAAHLAHPSSFVHGTGMLAQLKRSVPCVLGGLFFGVQVYALLAALDRGGSGRGLPFALATGVAANLLLQLSCPVTTPEHLLFGHLGVLLLLIYAIISLRRGTA